MKNRLGLFSAFGIAGTTIVILYLFIIALFQFFLPIYFSRQDLQAIALAPILILLESLWVAFVVIKPRLLGIPLGIGVIVSIFVGYASVFVVYGLALSVGPNAYAYLNPFLAVIMFIYINAIALTISSLVGFVLGLSAWQLSDRSKHRSRRGYSLLIATHVAFCVLMIYSVQQLYSDQIVSQKQQDLRQAVVSRDSTAIDQAIDELLDSNLDLNFTFTDQGGFSATILDRPIQQGDHEIVKTLTANGAEIDSSHLVEAVEAKDPEMVELLLSIEGDPDQLPPALYRAAETNQPQLIELLIGAGAPANARHTTVVANEYNDENYETALFPAARQGYTEIAETLIAHGADVNFKSPEGKSPLLLAASNGHLDLCRLLIDHGANINTEWLHTHSMGTQQDGEFIKVTLEFVDTPLVWAAHHGHIEIVQLLLDRGADVNLGSPIVRVAGENHVKIAKILIDHGANLNVQDPQGHTGLHPAASRGHTQMVRLLLDHGADPTPQNIYGETALDFARDQDHGEIIQLLEREVRSD